jgi:DNA-binding response OmpR family regulator
MPNGKVVLIVEDDDGIQESLKDALEDEGYVVAQAYNGREGLEYLSRERPSLVLLDFMMPVMNGVTFCEELRKREPTGVPVILLTADGRADERAREIGVIAFIRKPMTIEDLLAIVAKYAL